MNKRQTLTLMEMTVMLLVFALAAALCMGCFAWADAQARETSCRDRAMLQAQNAAEVLRSCNGDFAAAAAAHGGVWDGQCWVLDFDGYQILVKPESTHVDYLAGARIEAIYQGDVLISIPLRWQEVGYEA